MMLEINNLHSNIFKLISNRNVPLSVKPDQFTF